MFYDERKNLELTKAELAPLMHISQSAIARFENGAAASSTGMLEKVARVTHERWQWCENTPADQIVELLGFAYVKWVSPVQEASKRRRFEHHREI
ncbi:MAG: helix-turn-helix transcriptional regulator [Brevibacterium sp.]|uniref:helix-turn-helix domain-containing protein n=1 Tax=Brevibacterium sp. TaxID=1701 RepID=UPI0026472327|nr:helix-turn-helix transcriptional regulator [Brevibacterium sp.]MDN5806077.1 helix-turn-helix transcriptional regulator [Brevibacterium sp.]MDN5832614.1 helix-turn-helix transcriptional regulator [Brevibacterium sp.]MDN5877145.1 helix-turn-helix transcriptional regulator [Brevibacterium sp.]MDN5909126.1 helix-turn-helix transcriptional regulator [Brevibacterium sp.]MDN6122720.1 helix-turn-helix transcriptional regulator [Brevibacterium sp.]